MPSPSPPKPSPPELPAELGLLVLDEPALFPESVAPLDVGEGRSLALAEEILKRETPFVAVFARSPGGAEDELDPIGVLARVMGAARQTSGRVAVVVQGVTRVRAGAIVRRDPWLVANVLPVETTGKRDAELSALGMSLRDVTREVLTMLPGVPEELTARVATMPDPASLADFLSGTMPLSADDRRKLIAAVDAKERVTAVLEQVIQRREELRLQAKINAQVSNEMGKTQRQYMLRQQRKAIENELGEAEGGKGSDGLEDMARRIEEAGMPPEAADAARKQLARLRASGPAAPDYSPARAYLEWLIELPWQTATEDRIDLAQVKRVLEADHHGLEKVKRRIVEFLAVRKLGKGQKAPILCLVGPPGVGKTSLGKSVAEAMGRKLQRVSLGGVHDEAAIRGHRRTYVGALPGRIIQAMRKAGVVNPVLLLDEVDKLGQDFRGDPSSALLEVLDPEQNNTFQDHYLDVPYDLSRVMFITTANTLDTVPAPLRDRMEVIEIAGYTRAEKLAIARRHLLPKQLAEHGVRPDQLQLSDEAIATVIEGYTSEAGVRGLERQLSSIVRAVAVQIAQGDTGPTRVQGEAEVKALLGPPRFDRELAQRLDEPGVATGLARTTGGGELVFVEAMRMPGKGKLQLTGQLGEVMRESAQAALSYVRTHAERLGISPAFLDESDLHVHVPAAGTPKDGPSAGATMLVALVSLLTGVKAKGDVAVAGEVTLRGRVLPVGGVKEKVLAAHRAGIRKVVLPEGNKPDLEDVPAEVRSALEIVLVSRMDEVLEQALERPGAEAPPPEPRPSARRVSPSARA